MKKAVERIENAIEKKQKILIWGDFDCDGVTSSTVLYKALNALCANVEVFIPDYANSGIYSGTITVNLKNISYIISVLFDINI